MNYSQKPNNTHTSHTRMMCTRTKSQSLQPLNHFFNPLQPLRKRRHLRQHLRHWVIPVHISEDFIFIERRFDVIPAGLFRFRLIAEEFLEFKEIRLCAIGQRLRFALVVREDFLIQQLQCFFNDFVFIGGRGIVVD